MASSGHRAALGGWRIIFRRSFMDQETHGPDLSRCGARGLMRTMSDGVHWDQDVEVVEIIVFPLASRAGGICTVFHEPLVHLLRDGQPLSVAPTTGILDAKGKRSHPCSCCQGSAVCSPAYILAKH